jgi:hypothetical protein
MSASFNMQALPIDLIAAFLCLTFFCVCVLCLTIVKPDAVIFWAKHITGGPLGRFAENPANHGCVLLVFQLEILLILSFLGVPLFLLLVREIARAINP